MVVVECHRLHPAAQSAASRLPTHYLSSDFSYLIFTTETFQHLHSHSIGGIFSIVLLDLNLIFRPTGIGDQGSVSEK